MVADLTDGDKSFLWNGAEYFNYNNSENSANRLYICRDISTFDLKKHPNAQLKIYIWNRDKKEVLVNEMEVKVIGGNTNIYGLYEPIDKK